MARYKNRTGSVVVLEGLVSFPSGDKIGGINVPPQEEVILDDRTATESAQIAELVAAGSIAELEAPPVTNVSIVVEDITAGTSPVPVISDDATFFNVTTSGGEEVSLSDRPVGTTLIFHNNSGSNFALHLNSTGNINGGASGDSAGLNSNIAANMTAFLTRVSSTEWKGYQVAAAGTVTAIPASADV